MEENNGNFSEEFSEEELDEEAYFEDDTNKTLTIVLSIVVIVLLIAIGVTVGLLISWKGTTVINNITGSNDKNNYGYNNQLANEVANEVATGNMAITNNGENPTTSVNNNTNVNENSNTSIKTNNNVTNTVSSSNANNKQETKDTYAEGMRKIKTCLKDKNWIKENVMMKIDWYGDNIQGEQDLTFMILGKTKASDEPIIIVRAEAGDALSYQLYIVSYKDGKVISNPVGADANNNGHGDMMVDANNRVMLYAWLHMGYEECKYFNIECNKITVVDEIRVDNNNGIPGYYVNNKKTTKENYDSVIKKYSKYKFYTINTKLTDENVDKYILF